MKTTPCKGCGKPIVFGYTKSGTRIPLDTVAPTYAIVALEYPPGNDEIIRIQKLPKVDKPIEKDHLPHLRQTDCGPYVMGAYVTHFATCSHANEFGKGKKK